MHGYKWPINCTRTRTDHTLEKPVECGAGCLFDIQHDPGEHVDLAESHASKLSEMVALWKTRQATEFQVFCIVHS